MTFPETDNRRQEAPDVSIVIVSWNVRELLRDCLRSIREETAPDCRYELIVVDNASSDQSVDMIRAEFPWARLISSGENLGFAKANNRALPLCRGRYLLLLNPDTVVVDHALDRLVDWMEAHP